MKNTKLALYIAAELFLALMAGLIFVSTGNLANMATEAGLYETIERAVQQLYIYQALVVFIPFLVIFGLIIKEILKYIKEKEEQKKLAEEQANTVETEVQEDPEELRREQEEQIRKQMEMKRERLYSCIEEKYKALKNRDEKSISEFILGCLAQEYEITQAEIFLTKKKNDAEKLVLSATYAFYVPEEKVYEFDLGEGLIGQVAKASESLYLDELPEGYITVKSGLGSATPSHLLLVPWNDDKDHAFAVVEIASFKPFHKADIEMIEGLSKKIREYYQ